MSEVIEEALCCECGNEVDEDGKDGKCSECSEYTIDELSGSARDKALEKMYEFVCEDWLSHYSVDVRSEWAEEILPNEWAIKDVDHERMWFDIDRGQSLALTGGRVNLKKLLELKPELFGEFNFALHYAIEHGWVADPCIELSYRSEDTTGVGIIELDTDPPLKGTPFDGVAPEDFYVMAFQCDLGDSPSFAVALDDHVKEAAAAVLTALSEEFDCITSEDNLVELARANDYKFDYRGKWL